jgi:hypothetical protein
MREEQEVFVIILLVMELQILIQTFVLVMERAQKQILVSVQQDTVEMNVTLQYAMNGTH